jgi:hypothetical protein
VSWIKACFYPIAPDANLRDFCLKERNGILTSEGGWFFLEKELERVAVVQARLPQLRLHREESTALGKAARLSLEEKKTKL